MKEKNKEKIYEILKPVVEFIKEMGVDCKASIFRSNYGAIKASLTDEQNEKLWKFLEDNKDCSIFTYDEWLGSEYIIFSFTIDGKRSHAWE